MEFYIKYKKMMVRLFRPIEKCLTHKTRAFFMEHDTV